MEALKNYLIRQGLFKSDTFDKFGLFYSELILANETMNLTAVVDEQEVEYKHFIDSLAAALYINGEVLDIGAGAGFPSIPLAIVKPDIKFTLMDSVGKKITFLQSVSETLKLVNVEAIKSRAEDLSKSKKYDCVLSRGVGGLNIICEYGLPFVKLNGLFIAYKSKKAEEEIDTAQNALKILGGRIEAVKPYVLEFNGEIHQRNLIMIRKIKETDAKYPRGQNKPRLRPL